MQMAFAICSVFNPWEMTVIITPEPGQEGYEEPGMKFPTIEYYQTRLELEFKVPDIRNHCGVETYRGDIDVYIHPIKPNAFHDDWQGRLPEQTNDGLPAQRRNGGPVPRCDISVNSYNYFARIVQYLGPKSEKFMYYYHHHPLENGNGDTWEWILENYVLASHAAYFEMDNSNYSALFEIPEEILLGTNVRPVYQLRVDRRVQRPVELGRYTYANRIDCYEVQVPVAFYHKVRHFVNHAFPDVNEVEVNKAITLLFNHSPWWVETCCEIPRKYFDEPIYTQEPFPDPQLFPYNLIQPVD